MAIQLIRREPEIMQLAVGNIGALNCLMELARLGHDETIKTMAQIPLRGSEIYVLWSDLCGRDVQKCVDLVAVCPDDILKEACQRQDYSGRRLVEKYIAN